MGGGLKVKNGSFKNMHFFTKIGNFAWAWLHPYEGAGSNRPIFMIRVQKDIHLYGLRSDSKYFCNYPAFVRVTQRMRLKSECLKRLLSSILDLLSSEHDIMQVSNSAYISSKN